MQRISFAKKSTQRILKRALDICDRYGVKEETHVVVGDAKERICEAAAKLGAHFLVVGSHGHGTFVVFLIVLVFTICVLQSNSMMNSVLN